eukprot:1159001-Pelagomonas_calceolata.AAC.3
MLGFQRPSEAQKFGLTGCSHFWDPCTFVCISVSLLLHNSVHSKNGLNCCLNPRERGSPKTVQLDVLSALRRLKSSCGLMYQIFQALWVRVECP